MKKAILTTVLAAFALGAAAQMTQTGQMESINRGGQQKEQPTLTPAESKDVKKRYAAGERSSDLIKKYAIVMQNARVRSMAEYAARGEQVSAMVQDYFAGLNTKDRLKSENYFVYEQFTNSSLQPAAQFIMTSKAKFPAAERTKLETVLKQAVDNDVRNFFCGTKPADAATVKTLKDNIAKQKLNTDGKYDTAFKFIDARLAGSFDQYMDFCHENLATLSPEQQALVFGHFTSLVNTDDPTERSRVAKFLRNQLPQMDIEAVYQTIGEIVKLETEE